MTSRSVVACGAILSSIGFASICLAQTMATAVPVRELSASLGTSTERFGLILSAHGLSDGTVFVNDPRRRQILVLDSTLALKSIAFDSAQGANQMYGGGYAPLIPFPGDSSLFVDGGSQTLLMVAPNGQVARVMAAPISEHISRLTVCCAWSDASGNLVYRIPERREPLAISVAAGDTAAVRRYLVPGSATFIVRVNFATRRIDTLGLISEGPDARTTITLDRGRIINKSFAEPHPRPDDFAVLADGSVAIVRGQDYHVDIVRPSGERLTGPRLSYDWKRISEAEKRTIVDSLTARYNKGLERQRMQDGATRSGSTSPAGSGGFAAAGGSGMGGRTTSTNSAPTGPEIVWESGVLSINEISDYLPPIRKNAAKADADGNVWILTTTSAQSRNGELVYDVVNRDGKLTHRVRLPEGRSVVGFGRSGIVLLASRDSKGWLLERSRIKAQ